MKKPSAGMVIDTIDKQRKYVEAQKAKHQGLGIVFADAFLRGMRDLGYKDPGWALAELVDNSLQAGADTFTVRFGYEPTNKSQAKPDRLALFDNGNGMIPDMISYAVRWGGTDREGDRTGFGRYGYGLPSASVSLAKRYSVFAKTPKAEWHCVTVDIDELASAAHDAKKTQELLAAKKAKLPAWVLKSQGPDDKIDLTKLESGVVIVLEDLDRLRSLNGWIRSDTLKAKLLQHFGVVYRHFIPEKRIVVAGASCQAVDPLFLMEHGRLFDENSVRAEPIASRTFLVENASGAKGKVRIRAAVLPPNFQSLDPADFRPDMRGAPTNKRLPTMRDNNGLLICRAGRQIDCIAPDWTKFQNYDINIKIEIDFDPVLDEMFSITTAKQQVVINDDMWERLRNAGKNGGALEQLVQDMRKRLKELRDSLAAKTENKKTQETPRPSSRAMEETEKFKGRQVEPTADQQEQAERNLEREAAAQAEKSGRPVPVVLEELKEQTAQRRWEVAFAPNSEGPFFRPMRLGEQKRIELNTEHPFYAKVYLASPPEGRYALEVLLFVLAERELTTTGDSETFYKAERQRWSERLRYALLQLSTDESAQDKFSAVAEALHTAATE